MITVTIGLFGKDSLMPHSLAALTLLARDYDEAIAFFTEAL